MSIAAELRETLSRRVLFVCGKGGVGKTVVSQSIARAAARSGARTLWTTFEDPTRPLGEVVELGPRLWHLNASSETSFQEYATLKIGSSALTRIFLQNKLVRYMSKAAPGIHELVLLGKVWNERNHYDQVIVDMPSTGHGLAMFQSTKNFSILFTGGPIHRDAEAMIGTFGSPAESGHLIVALPEEMPLRESLELSDLLLELFPRNPALFLANRLFPAAEGGPGDSPAKDPDDWASPVPDSLLDYAAKRAVLERHNLRLWREHEVTFGQLPYIAPPADNSPSAIAEALSHHLTERGYR